MPVARYKNKKNELSTEEWISAVAPKLASHIQKQMAACLIDDPSFDVDVTTRCGCFYMVDIATSLPNLHCKNFSWG